MLLALLFHFYSFFYSFVANKPKKRSMNRQSTGVRQPKLSILLATFSVNSTTKATKIYAFRG
jgi:hypothetical protein